MDSWSSFGGHHVRVEGLPKKTDGGRSEDNGGGGRQIPAGYGRVGPEGGTAGSPAQILRRLVTRRFGEETAGQFSHLLDEPPGLVDIDRVTDALVECVTGDEFIDRVRNLLKNPQV